MDQLDSMKTSNRFSSIFSTIKTKEIRESRNKSASREPKNSTIRENIWITFRSTINVKDNKGFQRGLLPNNLFPISINGSGTCPREGLQIVSLCEIMNKKRKSILEPNVQGQTPSKMNLQRSIHKVQQIKVGNNFPNKVGYRESFHQNKR